MPCLLGAVDGLAQRVVVCEMLADAPRVCLYVLPFYSRVLHVCSMQIHMHNERALARNASICCSSVSYWCIFARMVVDQQQREVPEVRVYADMKVDTVTCIFKFHGVEFQHEDSLSAIADNNTRMQALGRATTAARDFYRARFRDYVL